jgi:hypothetical protein
LVSLLASNNGKRRDLERENDSLYSAITLSVFTSYRQEGVAMLRVWEY